MVACGPATPINPPAAAPTFAPGATVVVTSTSAASTPKTGGNLRAGLAGELTSIDGQQSLPGITATVGNAYETLTRYDDQLEPQPVLAESWDQSSDGKQIRVTLRKGVPFHDGREFTCDDVKYSLLRLRDPKVAPVVGPLANQSAWWTTVDTPHKYTIVLAASGVTDPEIELVYSTTSFGDTNAPLAQIVQTDLKSLLSVGSSPQLAEATSLLTRSRKPRWRARQCTA
jgi:ABC-type transport system substrate-binding protein